MGKRIALLGIPLALALPFVPGLVARSQVPESTRGRSAVPLPDAESAVASARDPIAIGPAFFPHEEHVEDFEIECQECHHETNATPLALPHPDYFEDFWIDCRICHHEQASAALGPQPCSACHHAGNGDIADETLSAKVVVHQSCWQCHEVGEGAEASASCTDCHRK